MSIHAKQAGQLVNQFGPRFYFETNSADGTGANLDHRLWRLRGVRFLVHLNPRVMTAQDCAAALIDNIQALKANFASANPGVQFPGYGVRINALGGAWAFMDFDGLLPFASHHPDDALPQY